MIDNKLKYEHHKLRYNFELAAKKMNGEGLVPSYAETLRTGLWDNMEILPKNEKGLQGQELLASATHR